MTSWILSHEQLVASAPTVDVVGGKGAGLVHLASLGCPVPPFIVVSTAGWAASGDGKTIPGTLAPRLAASLPEATDRLGPGPFAVRSSAVVEDGTRTSWAGQFDTVLGVAESEAIGAAVLTCWASGRGERALAYGALHGVVPGPMAVVVQQMIIGQASGVLFTRDPEDPEQALLSVGWGLGEGVVSGRVPCDTYRVNGRDEIQSEIDDKDEQLVLRDGEVVAEPVDAALREQPALGEAHLREVVAWGRRLERELGAPLDIEFTVDRGKLFLLQVRPITAGVPVGQKLLWDNSNIVESYSGMTTPLTFSFASTAYTIVYQLFCQVMGVDAATIRTNEPTFRRMIGLVRGRVYYNLNAWYRVLSLLPGFSFNREAMETMMGVSEVASDEDAGPPPPRWLEGLRLVRLSSRLIWRLVVLDRDAAAFQQTFDETLTEVKSRDLDSLRLDELLSLYEAIEQRLLWGWSPPLVNDFFCMIFYKLLQKRCVALTGDDETQLHNRLLAGEGTLASAAPARELVELVEVCRGLDGLRLSLTSDRSDDDVLAEVLSNPVFGERWTRWMDLYGDRAPDELKLESPPLTDTPEFVLGTVRAWLRDDQGRLTHFGQGEQKERGRAEVEAERLLDGWRARWGFRFILGQARRRVAMREALRFERTRIFGVVRRIFRAFGDRYTEAGILDTRDDVFFLTVDEILGFVRGTTSTTNLRGLAALRREEFEGFTTAPEPTERFYTWGAVHVDNRFRRGRSEPMVAPDGQSMVGTPCAPGTVVARAAVITDPRLRPDLQGGILVAHRTDPGWVPLFPTASAVLVERGSLLSHSAVVARELGLPAIVGLRGLLDWVEDGQWLGMDGASGKVWREEEPRG